MKVHIRCRDENETVCGANPTEKDLSFGIIMDKYFDPATYEKRMGVEICEACLLDAMHP